MPPFRLPASSFRPSRSRWMTIAALVGLTYLLPPSFPSAVADNAPGDETFDWDAACEEAEERAREEQRLIEKARQVNEGELAFIAGPPDPAGARMEKQLLLDRDSLESGWATMTQCHYHLDPAPAVQIVYNEERTRNIRITRRDGVGKARVEGPSIQMREIERGASLCVAARVLAIEPYPGGDGYLVENGPFMRRFLDGYYPMQVRLTVGWPANLLSFADSEPPPQPGLRLQARDDGVTLEAQFEGRLISRLHLLPGPALNSSATEPGAGSR